MLIDRSVRWTLSLRMTVRTITFISFLRCRTTVCKREHPFLKLFRRFCIRFHSQFLKRFLHHFQFVFTNNVRFGWISFSHDDSLTHSVQFTNGYIITCTRCSLVCNSLVHNAMFSSLVHNSLVHNVQLSIHSMHNNDITIEIKYKYKCKSI